MPKEIAALQGAIGQDINAATHSDQLAALLPRVQLLWVLTDPVILSSHSIQYIVLQSISAKVPIFSGDDALAHGGATAGLVPDLEDMGAKAAQETNRVMSGAAPRPGALLYPQGKLVLNQKTASLLQISFPPEMVVGTPSPRQNLDSILAEEAQFVEETIARVKRQQLTTRILLFGFLAFIPGGVIAWLILWYRTWKKVGKDYDIP